jgi:PHD/YefM family antitoxin component YafN of YafNO toxin-antitoxin module
MRTERFADVTTDVSVSTKGKIIVTDRRSDGTILYAQEWGVDAAEDTIRDLQRAVKIVRRMQEDERGVSDAPAIEQNGPENAPPSPRATAGASGL